MNVAFLRGALASVRARPARSSLFAAYPRAFTTSTPKFAFRSSGSANAGTHPIVRTPYARLGVVASIAALGISLTTFKNDPVALDAPVVTSTPTPREPLPPPPASSVNVYELSFGTVCGICAGVFLKKGAKALAFLFGGVFVLLQYFTSLSLVKVDWGRAASRFESIFYSEPTVPGGLRKAPSPVALWNWFINFLTADFQQRASFVAGFALGLRLG